MDTTVRYEILKILSYVIKQECGPNLDHNANFIEIFNLSSLDYVNLIVQIEKHFNINIPDEMLVFEEFNSINKIEEFLNNLPR